MTLRPTVIARRVLPALALAFVATAAGAQTAADFPATPPAPGPAPTLHVPTPFAQTLANGLRVIVVQRTGVPLVTAQLRVRSGGEVDPADKAGLADLTATLLTRGAAGLTAPQIAAAAETLGGSLQSGAGWDESEVGITVTAPKLPAALTLLADVVRQPTFAAAELERARAQTLDNLRLMLSQPTGLASLAANRAVFGAGAYGHSRSGTPDALARITRADVVRLHDTYYRPDNAILIFAGDIQPAQAQALAQKAFGNWRKPATALPQRTAGSAASQAPALLVIDQPGAGQAGVVAAHAAIRRDAPDWYAGTVANAVLGGSYSARLNEEIRIKRGLSYGANSRLQALRDAGLWQASAQTKNPSAPQVVDLMLGQFAALGTTPVPAAELAARKATLVGGYGRSLETTAGLAAQVADLALYDIDLSELGRYIEHVQAVTPAAIQAFAKAHLDAAGTHVVVVGDASQFGDAMKKAHPQRVEMKASAVDLDSPTLRKATP